MSSQPDCQVVDHPRFHAPDAEAFVEDAEREARESLERAKPNRREDTRGGRGLPGHLRALCRQPLLTAAEERALFLRMNFERHRIAEWTAARESARGPERTRLANAIRRAESRAEDSRQRIVLANTRLVVALARKFVLPTLSFDELMTAGLEPLIRAVDLFDVSRGFRFSTYATWAVRNHLLRLRKRRQRDQSRFRTGEEGVLHELPESDDTIAGANERLDAIERAVPDLLDRLDERDRTIVEARFGLNGHDGGRTFAQIGELVGLSKERTRQLANRALDQLREVPGLERLVGA